MDNSNEGPHQVIMLYIDGRFLETVSAAVEISKEITDFLGNLMISWKFQRNQAHFLGC